MVEPVTVISGVAGAVFIVIILFAEVAKHSDVPVRTQYVPAALANIDRVVSPVDQTYPPNAVSEEVSTTPDPGQIFEVFEEITGTVTAPLVETVNSFEIDSHAPDVTVTV